MRRILTQKFFDRPTLKVAEELLGKYLVRGYRGKEIAAMITEVEAYDGPNDKGSHASRGITQRTRIMFGPAGHWYVYFTYGMHWMLNIVTGPEEYPAAVLIRGVEDVRGPARVTKFFKIDKRFNGRSASRKTNLWIEDRGIRIKKSLINKAPRIGIDYAGPYWSKKRWRFFIQ